METFVLYLKAFVVGGLFCAAGQILIDKTKLTPARILSAYVVAGVILGALEEKGLIGAFTGGFTASAAGIGAAVFFGLIAALFFKSKDKS
ncbi:MAG: SpoVA/SpoVAEb family sporulation membrane protein [Bacillota bacterium]